MSTSAAMASIQEITSIGEATAVLYDDTSINGLNGPASLIAVKPSDRERPTAKMLEYAFYVYAPQFH